MTTTTKQQLPHRNNITIGRQESITNYLDAINKYTHYLVPLSFPPSLPPLDLKIPEGETDRQTEKEKEYYATETKAKRQTDRQRERQTDTT